MRRDPGNAGDNPEVAAGRQMLAGLIALLAALVCAGLPRSGSLGVSCRSGCPSGASCASTRST